MAICTAWIFKYSQITIFHYEAFWAVSQEFCHNEWWKMTALPHTIMKTRVKTLKRESNNHAITKSSRVDSSTFRGQSNKLCPIPLIVAVLLIPYAYFAHTHMGYPYDIFTEVLSYYKRLDLAHYSSIEVQTHRNCIILQNHKYFYRRLIYWIVLVLAI